MTKALDRLGERHKVLAVPPDYTRLPSKAGELTRFSWEYYGERLTDSLPALGTHTPMTDRQITHMFGDIPRSLFRDHDWRNDVMTLGEVPSEYVKWISEGRADFSWPAQVNKLIIEGGFDLILSIGQVYLMKVVEWLITIRYSCGTVEVKVLIKSLFRCSLWYGANDGALRYSCSPCFNYATEKYLAELPNSNVLPL